MQEGEGEPPVEEGQNPVEETGEPQATVEDVAPQESLSVEPAVQSVSDPSFSQPPPVEQVEETVITDGRVLTEIFGPGQQNDLLQAYVDMKQATGGQVNHLVERSLTKSKMDEGETFFIEAPGRHPLVFSNRLSDVDMKIFSQVFSVASHFLESLDLSYNLVTDDGIAELCNGLIGNTSLRLKKLILRGNTIGPKGCDTLCQKLKNNQSLQRLDLSQNPLGRVGGLMLVEFLQGNPQLMEVSLADTEIDIDVLVAISAVLLTGSSRLKVCNLENPRIQTLQEDHTVHLGRMLRVDTHLHEIYLGKHKMRDDGVRQLVHFLMENKTLRVLDLRCNELGAEGARHLSTLLSNDCQLVQLNLSGNRIGEKGNTFGAQALSEALMSNRMLKHLDLNNNGLCGAALLQLASAIDQNSTLQSIALFHSNWDQKSSFQFHQVLTDRGRILGLRADFVTSEVELRTDICQVQDFQPAR
jgi:Ran GTPase-activating protein (RanGAP) involved in mRNA processing and transport